MSGWTAMAATAFVALRLRQRRGSGSTLANYENIDFTPALRGPGRTAGRYTFRQMALICDGLNVLELGSASMAASMVGMVLADNGARVVKVEPPEGDRLRTENPSGFLVWNRGKESVVLDLRTAEDQSSLRDMASRADVVVEAFSPGVADGWGVGW